MYRQGSMPFIGYAMLKVEFDDIARGKITNKDSIDKQSVCVLEKKACVSQRDATRFGYNWFGFLKVSCLFVDQLCSNWLYYYNHQR